MSTPPIIEVKDVRKAYGEKVAVDDVTFAMPPDAILGMLGPNGAGKTSLIRMITTITAPDAGQIFFQGEPLSGYHPTQIGYLPEERGLYKKMYVGEQLLYLARLKGLGKKEAEERAREWLGKFNLEDQWSKKVEELSKGMQQQVQFIATVIHNPKLLILDEPFSGLDPVNATRMRTEILRLKEQGTGVIFSTHRMEQVEELCEYIVLINQGKNILEGKVAEIRRQFQDDKFHLEFEGDLPPGLAGQYELINPTPSGVDIQLRPGQKANDLLRYLLDHDVHIVGFQELLPSLNEVFIKQVTQLDPTNTNPFDSAEA
ncbi:ABC transporter ATP-binding protein [Neolewinella agarilytica]|jgi:ABC-2 type transport system ATP-binding protein|uniref:ABC-2 type transport system ATP-binding protein n=1 Tax=Neolewinella agarilytica TaxID=478744 RepID=A0A1H9NGW3_9BACT|nr:ATP-binding cassette domain-containing protein [Neolewinella agarilytica]SER34633.1 ABC-2 type transport system ATP-binding protein [Neolewinella agarilytica]